MCIKFFFLWPLYESFNKPVKCLFAADSLKYKCWRVQVFIMDFVRRFNRSKVKGGFYGADSA